MTENISPAIEKVESAVQALFESNTANISHSTPNPSLVENIALGLHLYSLYLSTQTNTHELAKTASIIDTLSKMTIRVDNAERGILDNEDPIKCGPDETFKDILIVSLNHLFVGLLHCTPIETDDEFQLRRAIYPSIFNAILNMTVIQHKILKNTQA